MAHGLKDKNPSPNSDVLVNVHRKVSAQYPIGCLIQHPSFSNNKAYVVPNILILPAHPFTCIEICRFYKETHQFRITVGQYFSRLVNRDAKQTTHYKLRIVQNQMAIAHLTMFGCRPSLETTR
ncbi:MAG: hypothetical protein HZC52_01100 [Planctomycetes bacterium]|uniref:hypothetical protein n=1 Tax=Candidatus Wunengus sp. YC65 TaxID=3367701 RepID=UPI001DABA86F|nr:hypothetical protein [Planctomycetota bacterium]